MVKAYVTFPFVGVVSVTGGTGGAFLFFVRAGGTTPGGLIPPDSVEVLLLLDITVAELEWSLAVLDLEIADDMDVSCIETGRLELDVLLVFVEVNP